VINIKCPSGSRIELSNQYIAQVENEIRKVVPPQDLDMIVSNIGITPDLSAIYTSNSAMDTAFVQVSLKENHTVGSYQYMERVRRILASDMPELTTYFQAGGLVDSVINQGLPAPIDIQVSGNNLDQSFAIARQIATEVKGLKNVSDVLIPQDLKYPGLQLNIDRERASLIHVSPKEVVDNVITAMTSNGMIAPSYWIDPNTGNNYMLTVQYFDQKIAHMTMNDFRQIPLRPTGQMNYTPLQSVADIKEINTPTEVDHYQIRRIILRRRDRLHALSFPSRGSRQGIAADCVAIHNPMGAARRSHGRGYSHSHSCFRRCDHGPGLQSMGVYPDLCRPLKNIWPGMTVPGCTPTSKIGLFMRSRFPPFFLCPDPGPRQILYALV